MTFTIELERDSDNTFGSKTLEVIEHEEYIKLRLHNPDRTVEIDREEWKRLCKMTST